MILRKVDIIMDFGLNFCIDGTWIWTDYFASVISL